MSAGTLTSTLTAKRYDHSSTWRVCPDFYALHSTPDQTVSLSDFKGQNVILAFYPADWSPC